MKQINLVVFILLLILGFSSYAKKRARPFSIAGDYLLELTTGLALEDDDNIFELGMDLERFVDGTHHHCSVGIASEVSFHNGEKEYYFGPLLSLYYYHTKLFATYGITTDFKGEQDTKARVGLGYEFVFLKHYVLVPSIAYDFHDSEETPVLGLGLAFEF